MRLTALSTVVPDPEQFRTCPPARPQVWHLPPGPIQALLGLADADRLLSSVPLTKDLVSVIHDGRRSAPAEYTWATRPVQRGFADMVRPGTLAGRLSSGSTIVLEALHRTWPAVGELCRRLSYEAGVPVSANAYLTPQDSQGFAHHYDTHAVLIVQTAGSKTWQLHEPVFVDPLEHQPFRAGEVNEADWARLRTGAPALEVTLRPGDTLWIPRGWIHNGFATDEVSLHVSLSFPSPTGHWVASELLRRLDSVPELRRDLPWGFTQNFDGRRAAIEGAVKTIVDALTGLDADQVGDELADAYARYYLEPERHAVADVLGAPVTADTRVRTVAEAVVRQSRTAGGQLRLHLGDTVLLVEAETADQVEQLLRADALETWCARDLVTSAQEESRAVELVGQLVRAGVLRLEAVTDPARPGR